MKNSFWVMKQSSPPCLIACLLSYLLSFSLLQNHAISESMPPCTFPGVFVSTLQPPEYFYIWVKTNNRKGPNKVSHTNLLQMCINAQWLLSCIITPSTTNYHTAVAEISCVRDCYLSSTNNVIWTSWPLFETIESHQRCTQRKTLTNLKWNH